MFNQDYCRALELRMFSKSKEIRRLKSQLFVLRLISFVSICLYIISQV